MDLIKYKKVHCVGIGGIGISALARLLSRLGITVTGSDLYHTKLTDALAREGISVAIGKHKASNLDSDVSAVVYSPAVPASNLELKKAKKLKIERFSYPQFLAGLMESYLPLVVSGTHGKSTTTAMLGHIFIAAGLDPTIVVGTQIDSWGGNARLGLGRHFIVEGDEYRESFLNYSPIGLIITNIEADHLDYYKNVDVIKKAFKKLVKKVPAGGFIIANSEDKNVREVVKTAKCRVISFGTEQADYLVTQRIQHGELTRFMVRGMERFDLALRVAGQHNALNALAATTLALAFGVAIEDIQRGLLEYRGAWRRFQIKGNWRGVTIIDDYGHHPTEIKAVLKTAREIFPKRRIWCIYQAHSLDRTKALLKYFARAFVDCDQLVLADIYDVAGRDKRSTITVEKFRAAITEPKEKIQLIKNYKRIPQVIRKKLKSGDVVIVMGAGTITEIADKLLK